MVHHLSIKIQIFPHAVWRMRGGGSWVECKRKEVVIGTVHTILHVLVKFSLLPTVTACDEVNLHELINTNSHSTHVSVFSASWLKERDCLYVWRHTQEFLDWVDNKNICWPLLFVVSFPLQSISHLNLCNRSNISSTAGSILETEFFEPPIEQSITLPEFI